MTQAATARTEILRRELDLCRPLSWHTAEEIAVACGTNRAAVEYAFYRLRRERGIPRSRRWRWREREERERYPAVWLLLDELPASGEWTQAERDRWLAALTALVDLLVEVTE